MKTALFLFSLFFITNSSYSQGDKGNHVNVSGANPIFLLQEIIDKIDKNNEQSKVLGSPYWSEGWSKGTLTAVSGRSLKDVLIRYNVLEKRIEVKDKDKIFQPSETISEFTIEKTEKAENEDDGAIITKKLIFRAGFSPANTGAFYNVLYDGKTKVLKAKDKRIEEIVPYGQAPGKKMVEETYYYLFKNTGELIKINKNKSSVLKAIASKEKEIELDKYITANKLKVENEDHLIQLIKYYDSIAL